MTYTAPITAPITALCLTRPGREGLALRAIGSFLAQRRVPNARMLLAGHDPALLERLLACHPAAVAQGRLSMLGLAGSSVETLLRRAVTALKASATGDGDLLALWDDDDTSHPLRLARQAERVQAQLPCFLSTAFWHFYDSQELFIYEFEVRHRDLQTRILPGTLVVRLADMRPEDTSWNRQGSPTVALGRAVQKRCNSVRLAEEFGWLKIGVRGDNAQGYEAHRSWSTTDKARPVDWLVARRTLICHWLDGYAFDPGPLDVCGRDGVAFRYEPGCAQAGMPPVGEPIGIHRVTEFTPEEQP